MRGFILASDHEPDRLPNVGTLQTLLPGLKRVEAVYPAYRKVPFISRMIHLSGVRTGKSLSREEIGCLLSHRKVWSMIVKEAADAREQFLVVESDSKVEDLAFLTGNYEKLTADCDIFFWGAWDGYMKLLKSSIQKMGKGYTTGRPFLKSVYGAYGYSLNKKAARHLLEKTAKINYQADQFKRFLRPDDLVLGGVRPEVITTLKTVSYIQKQRINKLYKFLFFKILDIKNSIMCFLR